MPERVRVATGSIFDTFNMLDTICHTLGAGSYVWPFIEDRTGALTFIQTYSPTDMSLAVANAHAADEAADKALETEWSPVRHVGGICSYYFGGPTPNNHLWVADAAGFSFVAHAFSLGIWAKPDTVGTAQSLIAKYGSTATLREYDFRITAGALLALELYDESADTTEIATAPAGQELVANRWQHLVVTYDGVPASPTIKLYKNGVKISTTDDSVETGAFVDVEDTAAALMIGARDATGSPAQEFLGRLAMPFVAAKALDAGEVAKIHRISRALLGLG